MNGTYYPNPTFPNNMNNYNQDQDISSTIPNEQNYLNNIYLLNKGKKVKVHASFYDSQEYKDHTFDGIIEQTGNDYLILSNPESGNWFLIPIMNINFTEFEEPINNLNYINKIM